MLAALHDAVVHVLLHAARGDVLDVTFEKGSAPGTARLVAYAGPHVLRGGAPGFRCETADGAPRVYALAAVSAITNITGAYREV